MQLQKKVESALKHFIYKERPDGSHFYALDGNAPTKLQESIHKAHGDRFPSDWHYETYHDCLDAITQYSAESVDELRDHGYDLEISESLVDVYTSNLTAWLNSHNENVYYLTEALSDGLEGDGFSLLTRAQYLAIYEVMQEVISYLE